MSNTYKHKKEAIGDFSGWYHWTKHNIPKWHKRITQGKQRAEEKQALIKGDDMPTFKHGNDCYW